MGKRRRKGALGCAYPRGCRVIGVVGVVLQTHRNMAACGRTEHVALVNFQRRSTGCNIIVHGPSALGWLAFQEKRMTNGVHDTLFALNYE